MNRTLRKDARITLVTYSPWTASGDSVALTLVFAEGLGVAIALVTSLFESDHLTAERWAHLNSAAVLLGWLTAAGVGVVALWVAVLASPPL